MNLFSVVGDFVINGASSASASIRSVGNAAQTVADKLAKAADNMVRFGNKMTLVATVPIVALGKSMFELGSNAEDTAQLFEDSFGRMSGAANSWSRKLAEEFDVNETNIKDFAAKMNLSLLNELDEKDAFGISTDLTKLSYSLMTAYNMTMKEAQNALSGAMAGNSTSLNMKTGIKIGAEDVKRYAVSKGIVEDSQNLTEAQKIIARYGLIMERTTIIQNNFQENMDSAAGMSIRYRDRLQTLREEFGENLLPIVVRVMEKVMELVNKLIELDEGTQNNILKTIAFAAVLGPAARIMGGFINTVSLLSDGMAWLGTKGIGGVELGLIGLNIALWGYILKNEMYANGLKAIWYGTLTSMSEINLWVLDKVEQASNFLGFETPQWFKDIQNWQNNILKDRNSHFIEAIDLFDAAKDEAEFERKVRDGLSDEAYQAYLAEKARRKELENGVVVDIEEVNFEDILAGAKKYAGALDDINSKKRESNNLDKEKLDLARKMERASLIEIQRDLGVGKFAKETGRQFRISGDNATETNNSRVEQLLETLIDVIEDQEVNVSIDGINKGVESNLTKNISTDRRRTSTRSKLAGGLV